MNVKAMLFAALGLAAAAIPTTLWVSSNMRAIEQRQTARLQQECQEQTATLAARGTDQEPTTTGQATAPMPAAGDSASLGPEDPCVKYAARTGKPVPGGAAGAQPTTGSMDPAAAAGQAQASQDAYAASGDPGAYGGDPGAYGGDPGAYGGEPAGAGSAGHGSF